MRSWVGGGEGFVFAKAVKIVTFGIHYSQIKTIVSEQTGLSVHAPV